MFTNVSKTRFRFRNFVFGALGLLGGTALMAEDAARPLSPEPKPWLRWLGPLAPQGTSLPPVPMPPANPNQVWTVDQVLARALRANPDVQVALATVQRQDGIRLQAVSALLPRVSISGSADQRADSLVDHSQRELDNVTPLNPLTSVADRSYHAQIELRQLLFDGLGSWHQVRRAAYMEKKAAVDARDLYLRLTSQVRQAFDNILLRQMIVSTRRDAVRDLAHLADVAKKRRAVGEISEFETLRAETALRSAEAELAQAESDVARGQELLCRLIYIEKPAGGLRLSGELAPVDYKETFPVALSRAQAGRLDVRSAELQHEAAKMAHRAAYGGFAPRVEFFVNYGYRSSYFDVHKRLEGWTVGIVGRWDIFDAGQTGGVIRMQNADRRAAEIRVADTRRVVPSQIRELFGALEGARSVMAGHASARDLGERSVREARALYEAGRVSLEQVLTAELAYRQAVISWLTAVFNNNTTIYQLDYATANEAFLENAVNGVR